ncbi:MAG: D-2-hydroxyacid dehydrogenase [Rhizobiaceae bacterium]
MTTTPKIVIHNDRTSAFAAMLSSAFTGADFCECNTYEDLPGLIESYRPEIVYTVRFSGTPGFPRAALFGPEGPRWIANGGAGTDHFGIWDKDRVTVTNAAGVAAEMMAEYVIGGFLHFTLDVPGLEADKGRKIWQTRQMQPLKGSTLLIVGLGHTGRALAARAKSFGMQVIGTRSTPRPMDDVDKIGSPDDLPGLLPLADFIAVCAPLTRQTRGLLGESEFTQVKPGVILADVSRGGVVDQQALLKAVESGHVKAAVLDVFETEPLPSDSFFWEQDNVLISPHCSSVFDGWEEASFDIFLANLNRWIVGEPLVNVVNPQRGY